MQLDTYISSDVSTMSVTKWFEHFTKCYNFIAKWASMNTSANQSEPKLPSAFWLAALTLPKGKYKSIFLLCVRHKPHSVLTASNRSSQWLEICIQQYTQLYYLFCTPIYSRDEKDNKESLDKLCNTLYSMKL